MVDKENKKKKNNNSLGAGLAAAASYNISKYGYAASEFIKGYNTERGLKDISNFNIDSNNVYRSYKQQAGFSAEVFFQSKENAEKIIKEKNIRVTRTDEINGMRNHQNFDHILTDQNGNPILDQEGNLIGSQMKFNGRYTTDQEINKSAKRVVDKLSNNTKWEKYRGKPVNIPSEQYEYAKEYAHKESLALEKQAQKFYEQGNKEKGDLLKEKSENYKQVAKDIQDSGISSEEAMFLRKHPKLATIKSVAKVSHQAGIEQAKAGAIFSGVISSSRNILAVAKGEKDVEMASKDIAKDVGKGAAFSYSIGAGGAAIKSVLQNSKSSLAQNVSKSNMPAMIATTTLQVGKSISRYAKGEITELELIEELGEKGTGMLSASMGAAIGGSLGTMILPGVGTITGSFIGGMLGYMISSQIYQSTMQILKEERISNEKRKIIKEISEKAIEEMKKEREQLIQSIKMRNYKYDRLFNEGFKIIEEASRIKNVDIFTEGLTKIALAFGESLQFEGFDEFDEFMKDKDTVLEL